MAKLGTILLHNNLIDRENLQKALDRQKEYPKPLNRKRLGDILIELGEINYSELMFALALQSRSEGEVTASTGFCAAILSGLRRVRDILAALVGLSILGLALPMIATAIYVNSPGSIFLPQYRIGLRGKRFKIWEFRTTILIENFHLKDRSFQYTNYRKKPSVTRVGKFLRKARLDKLPLFLNVLRGEMSLFGIYPATCSEVRNYYGGDWLSLAVKPGIINLQQINKRSVNRFSLFLDNVVLRTLLWRSASTSWKARVQLLNVQVDNLTRAELLENLNCGVVLTLNADHLMNLQRDPEFFNIYCNADYKICDSRILFYASYFLGNPLREKIAGSDFFPAFYQFHRDNENVRIFLLGGDRGVAEKAKESIERKIERSIIVGAHSPSFGFEQCQQECLEIINKVNQCRPTVLAVGVGSPKQEKWIYQFKEKMPTVKIFLAIGATIDFEAGVKKRAPRFLSYMGLEWAFRLYSEPKRLWKRYLIDDIPVLWLILKQKLGLYSSPFCESSQCQIADRFKDGIR
ncbi:WecB/TagA/CpsF family glycosyltransferase [Altericista sp. CCNU0014]|uniref:WecB/TagA/CpsF family glycosyltransferase n=1 Tax=Altericista sp. CCNU0014 TaxID=3082949 RepID=UPI00384ECC6E